MAVRSVVAGVNHRVITARTTAESTQELDGSKAIGRRRTGWYNLPLQNVNRRDLLDDPKESFLAPRVSRVLFPTQSPENLGTAIDLGIYCRVSKARDCDRKEVQIHSESG